MFDKVKWHTKWPDNIETVEQIHLRFRSVITFFQENGLTKHEILSDVASVTDDTLIRSSDLTEVGVQLAMACYREWLEQVDRGLARDDMMIFERELRKLRHTDKSGISRWMASLSSVVEQLANDSDWQRAYEALPRMADLDDVERLAVIEKLNELKPTTGLRNFRLPSIEMPEDEDAESICGLRNELYETVLESPVAQEYLLGYLTWQFDKDLQSATSEADVAGLQSHLVEVEDSRRLHEQNATDFAARLDSNSEDCRLAVRARRTQIRMVVLKLLRNSSQLARAIQEFAEVVTKAERLIGSSEKDDTASLERLACQTLEEQVRLLVRVRRVLNAYCDAKEHLLSRYLGYVVLESLYCATFGVDPCKLGRVGLHSLSKCIDKITSKPENVLPRWIMWTLDKSMRPAVFELLGFTENDYLAAAELREAKKQLGPDASIEEITEVTGIQPEDGLRHLRAMENPTPVSSARLTGRPITRDLVLVSE